MSVRREGRFKNAAAKVENGMRRGLIEAGMLVAQRAQGKAPRDTGRLKRSITHGQPYSTGPHRMAIDVGTDVIYARVQEFGDPNELIIYPATKKALAFEWSNAPEGIEPGEKGKFVFAHVTRGPIKAQPYLQPALDESRADVKRLILASVLGALRKP